MRKLIVNEKYNNKNKIYYKYLYYFELNKLEVYKVDKNIKVNSIIEQYIYNNNTKEVNCIVGQCADYNEIMKIFEKYINELK